MAKIEIDRSDEVDGSTGYAVGGARTTGDVPTCRLTLLHVGRAGVYRSAPQSQSQDELIHLIDGLIFVGRQELVAGDTLAIGADVRYGFRGADT